MLITCTIYDHVALITLCDEKRLNVLSKDLINQLNHILDDLEKNDSIHVVILTGSGTFFSAGANLKELISYKKNNETYDFIEDWQHLSNFTKPVIVALNGSAFGGGLELALMGDILMASESVMLALPELSVGVIPGGGGTQRLTELIGPYRTNYLCMTGQKITAYQAQEWGVIQLLSKDQELISDALKLAQDVAKKPLPLLKEVKKCIRFASKNTLQKGMKMERESFFKTLSFKGHDEAISSFFKR